jgi:hypothetical protein
LLALSLVAGLFIGRDIGHVLFRPLTVFQPSATALSDKIGQVIDLIDAAVRGHRGEERLGG